MLAEPGPALVPSAESYRIAKLNFTGAVAKAGASIVMFTSAGEKDGTSEVVANLALVLARGGKHVVLVDANLRDPVQADHFRQSASLGLADVLSGEARACRRADQRSAEARWSPRPDRERPRSRGRPARDRAGRPGSVRPR